MSNNHYFAQKGPQKENNAIFGRNTFNPFSIGNMDSIRTKSVQQGMKIILTLIMPLLLASCSCSSGHDSSESTPEPPASPTSMLVALSFDDGPTNQTTPKVLDVLEEFDVPASFFVIGQNINDSSAEHMKRAVSLGCEIQNHSFTHSFMTKLSAEEVQDEIRRTDDLVEKYTGIRPWLFRPPYIDCNENMHGTVEHTFISGVGCQDWEADRSAQTRFEDLMAKVQDGDIILLHDFQGNDNTVDALKLIIPELKKRGYTLVTVSQLFESKDIKPEPRSGFLYTNVLQKEKSQNR